MVFKLVDAAQKSWRRLDGHNQLPKLIQGVRFTDGIEVATKSASSQSQPPPPEPQAVTKTAISASPGAKLSNWAQMPGPEPGPARPAMP